MGIDNNPFSEQEIWFVTGSQHLYGADILKRVREHSQIIVDELEEASDIPVKIIDKALLTTSEEILFLIRQANASPSCIGLIAWMHTFSPAKMWINGLRVLAKPMLHFHTQFLQDIPWSEIDMDYMNLNQSAHGGREFGFINTRMGLNRKVVVGHYKDSDVHQRIAVWSRVASAVDSSSRMKVARFGDNMRSVAVTEGNKVSAQIKFGYEVSGYGLSDLADRIAAVRSSEMDELVELYHQEYELTPSLKKDGPQHGALKEAAKIELGLRSFLEEGGFEAFTDTFEDLGSLKQLPGLPVQRLMADGYGFGAEGDWKTAALLRTMKIMSWGLEGGMSFMEDYTYHFNPSKNLVLGAHMLEICPSIASTRPSCEIHPLGIGGKSDPVRLVFNGVAGPALNASLIDLGHRFRLVVNEVDTIQPEHELPRLPVARVLWDPKPNLKDAATAWILAGGAHHTVFSQSIGREYLEDYAEMMDLEMVLINDDMTISRLKQDLRSNEVYYRS